METCYRHSGRETGVSCSNCGRPICPDCMTPTSVGMRCPECSGEKQKVVRGAAAFGGGDPVLTYVLIGINVAVALGDLLSGGGGATLSSGGELATDGGLNGPLVADGDWYRIVTSGFLHYGFFHLLLNMFVLYLLGSELEPALGRLRFGLVYGLSLLGGSLGALLLEPDALTVGASGAVFGVMGAALVYMRSRGINPFQTGLGLIVVLNLVLSLRPGISLGGHLGGFLVGALATFILVNLAERTRAPAAVPLVASAALGAGLLAGALAAAAGSA